MESETKGDGQPSIGERSRSPITDMSDALASFEVDTISRILSDQSSCVGLRSKLKEKYCAISDLAQFVTQQMKGNRNGRRSCNF